MQKLRYPNLRKGLVGAWCPSIDRSRSTLLIDQSGYGNHGTLTNMDAATDWVASDGKVALDFDGNDEYVAATPDLSGVSASLSCWVKLRNATPVLDTKSGFVAQTLTPTAGKGSHYPYTNGICYLCTFRNVRVDNIILSSVVDRTKWHNVLVTTDGVNWKFFQSGIQVHSVAAEASVTFSKSTFTIAKTPDHSTAYCLDGQLDDLRVYNRALTPSEVATLALRRGIAHETYRVPVVRGASVGSSHSLTANGIATGAPSLGTPALTQVHALTANNISTGTPSAGTPAITQTHSIAATAISTGAPSLGTPSLTESNSLTATGIATGAPSLGTPTISQTHTLTATGVSAGAPSLGTPALAQVHVFTATGIATGAPSLGTPLLTIAGTLVADNITTGTPTLGSPAIAQVHGLLANAIATGAPSLGQPGLTQVHGFTATGIATGAPSLGSPSLSTSDAMIANGIVTGTPSLGSPSLSQVHVLVCSPISTGAPTLGQPTIAQTHSLIAMGIVTGAPTVGTPTLDGVSFLPEWASQANVGVGL